MTRNNKKLIFGPTKCKYSKTLDQIEFGQRLYNYEIS